MKIATVGIDSEKNLFQVHGVDEHGRAVLQMQLKREQIVTFFVALTCLTGMEACGSARHWARNLQSMGHTVRLIAPRFMKPYVETNKNDTADTAAICEAVGSPNMRLVPAKNVEQQAVWALHRVRHRPTRFVGYSRKSGSLFRRGRQQRTTWIVSHSCGAAG